MVPPNCHRKFSGQLGRINAHQQTFSVFLQQFQKNQYIQMTIWKSITSQQSWHIATQCLSHTTL